MCVRARARACLRVHIEVQKHELSALLHSNVCIYTIIILLLALIAVVDTLRIA